MTLPTPADLAGALEAYRSAQPLTQCLTNIVVAQWTANVVLAAGGSPAMVDNQQEASGFAQIASGVLVNLGTPYEDTAVAMREAVAGCGIAGTPWVLDPIGAGGLPWRTALALELLELGRPAVIRGNASEIDGLAGGMGGKGADSAHEPDDVAEAARTLAVEQGCVVAVSGARDLVTDGERTVRLDNGNPLMTRVTGVGCCLGALMAGYAAVVDDALVAAASATAHLTVAGERAGARTSGPGTFAVALLDELAAVTPDDLAVRVRLS